MIIYIEKKVFLSISENAMVTNLQNRIIEVDDFDTYKGTFSHLQCFKISEQSFSKRQ